jgi:hypothetical protein
MGHAGGCPSQANEHAAALVFAGFGLGHWRVLKHFTGKSDTELGVIFFHFFRDKTAQRFGKIFLAPR